MKPVYASYTHQGSRPKNEDVLYTGSSGGQFLAVVADGLGGHAGSEMASSAAVRIISEQFLEKNEFFSVNQAIADANQTVLNMRSDAAAPMTTAAVALIGEQETVLANVGDTRIYAFCRDKLIYQSRDHSVSQMAVLVGEIAASEIRTHADRNKLTQALGMAEKLHPEIHMLPNQQYDALLLCTDGFWQYVYETEMTAALADSKHPQEWLDKMRWTMLRRISGNYDNNTAVTIIRQGEI